MWSPTEIRTLLSRFALLSCKWHTAAYCGVQRVVIQYGGRRTTAAFDRPRTRRANRVRQPCAALLDHATASGSTCGKAAVGFGPRRSSHSDRAAIRSRRGRCQRSRSLLERGRRSGFKRARSKREHHAGAADPSCRAGCFERCEAWSPADAAAPGICGTGPFDDRTHQTRISVIY